MQVSSPFDPSSPQAQAILHLFVVTLIVSAVILSVVTGLVIYICIRYRSRAGEGEPRQEFGQPKLEMAWTIVPVLIVIALFVLMLDTMRVADPQSRRQADLQIIGHQWWWEVRYAQSGVITANEIHVPVGKRLLLQLESADVIHDFWVPQLGRKMDMIPGQSNYMWIEAGAPGIYSGACAEYCGAEHAWMRIRVVAEPQADFEAWQRGQMQTAPSQGQTATTPSLPATTSTPAEAPAGAQLFQQMTCRSCHAVAGTGANARVGPDLTHLASRQTLAAGRLENNPTNLARWLADPQAVKPGTYMPDLQLSDEQVRQLVAYLETLK